MTGLFVVGLAGCGRGSNSAREIVSKPQQYVGSEQCKICHLEHYDSWRATLHSRSIQDVSVNLEAARHEKPAWIARLEQTGKLSSQLVAEVSVEWRALFHIFGYCALGCS